MMVAAFDWSPGGCCCGRVLIWLANQSTSDPVDHATFDELEEIYRDMGLIVDVVVTEGDEWTDDINDYRLVFVESPDEDPPWWGPVEAGEWNGRMVIMGEHSGIASAEMYDWINGLTPITTINIESAQDTTQTGTIEDDPLTEGMVTEFSMTAVGTAYVDGGDVLSIISGFSRAWLSHKVVDTDGVLTDWVISGDANLFIAPKIETADNTTFAQNLWTVPIS